MSAVIRGLVLRVKLQSNVIPGQWCFGSQAFQIWLYDRLIIGEWMRLSRMMARKISTDFSARQACGKYQLEHILGKGGMAVVWKAWDPGTSQHVAIKVVAESLLADPGISARFADELRRHAR